MRQSITPTSQARSLRPIFIIIYGFFYLFCLPSSAFAEDTKKKLTIGRVEEVTINESDFTLQAKIDTGAENSSLNAADIHLVQRGKEKWIKFAVTNRHGKTLKLEHKIIRFVSIKRKEATTQQRPSIQLDICLGGVLKRVEVNLINRSNFNYQMLIGSSFLKGTFIVDVEKILTHKPICHDRMSQTDKTEED